MKYGLKDETIQKIQKVFSDFSNVDEVILFGSRANGKYKTGSDIDLALKGKELNFEMLNKISLKLEDLNTPYKYDLVNYHQVKDLDLLEHINKVGILFYKK
ncbi:MAG: nucleotidyltransferase domain-containing protein [Leptospiraceae bacterium]|nr:nucleotidyltransferase domain-containing protein [Leptospiraceae bacterium]